MNLKVGQRVEIDDTFFIPTRRGQIGVITARYNTLKAVEKAMGVLAYGAQSVGAPWFAISFDARFSGDKNLYAQGQLRPIA